MPVPAQLPSMNQLLDEALALLTEIKSDLEAGRFVDAAKVLRIKEALSRVIRLKYEMLSEFPPVDKWPFTEVYRLLQFIDSLINKCSNLVLIAPVEDETLVREMAKKWLRIALAELAFLESNFPPSPGAQGFSPLRSLIEDIMRALDDELNQDNCLAILRQYDRVHFLKYAGCSEVQFEYCGMRLSWWYEQLLSIDVHADPIVIENLFGEYYLLSWVEIIGMYLEAAKKAKERIEEVMGR